MTVELEGASQGIEVEEVMSIKVLTIDDRW